MSNDSVLVISIFILVVQGKLQGFPVPKKIKIKEHSSKFEKSLMGTQKIWLDMVCEKKIERSAKVLGNKKWEPPLKYLDLVWGITRLMLPLAHGVPTTQVLSNL
jgi:hypothetical protein